MRGATNWSSSSTARVSRLAPPPRLPTSGPRSRQKDATTFRAIGMGGMSVVFKIEADKVTGLTLMPPQGGPVVYTRTEGK